MKFEELKEELEKLFPDFFEEPDKDQLKEVKTMNFPKDFLKLYAKKSPAKILEIGKFRLLPLENLIDENVWFDPGEAIYPKGFSVVGSAANGYLYCLTMKEKNSTGQQDLYFADHTETFEGMDFKEIRMKMKFLGNSLEAFLTRELEFCKKSKSKK